MKMSEQSLSTKAEKQVEQEVLRRRRAIAVSLVTSFLFLAITAVFLPQLMASESPIYWGLPLTIQVALIGLISVPLAWGNRPTLLGILLIGRSLIFRLGLPMVCLGQAV